MSSQFEDKIISCFGNGGVISRALNNYESRLQQLQMAQGICRTIETGSHLIVEAGTGVGKSLAYLVPFIIHSAENKKKIIISTNTKTLQQQLYEKDLPFLKQALGIDFNYCLCLGSENYLCLRRLRDGFIYDLFDGDAQREELRKINEWSLRTAKGIKSGLKFVPQDEVWDKVCRDPDLCLGNKCSHKDGCFYREAKRYERVSHILVTNHALFFTNLASGGAVLPAFDAVVFDEGHTLEDVATSHLGHEISNTKIKYLLDSIYNPKTGKGILLKFKEQKAKIKSVTECLEESRIASREFFEKLAKLFGAGNEVKRIKTKNIIYNFLEEPLNRLAGSMARLLENARCEEDEVLIRATIKKCLSLRDSLIFILNLQNDDYVYWAEIYEKRGKAKYTLFAEPIEIAGELDKQLFSKVKPIVLTSATLAANGNFSFIRGRIGINDCAELLLDSPFDYKKNALLYLEKGITEPRHDAFEKQALAHIKELIDIMRGRTFVLFTSYKMMRYAYDGLRLNYSGINLLKQGDKPQYELLNDFKRKENSVLLGTNTFWQGVDVPGKALECVVITKLPFLVPDDPVTEARMELIKSRRKDPFLEYQVPQAIMMFKQGFGRLIRTKSDRGVVAVLDPRIITKNYGDSFLKDLPKCRRTSDINEVRDFFKESS